MVPHLWLGSACWTESLQHLLLTPPHPLCQMGKQVGSEQVQELGQLRANGAAWPPQLEPEAQSPDFTAEKLTSVPQWPRICCPSPVA